MQSTSPERPPERVLRLDVTAEQPAARITVVDHAWRVVARGIGSLSADLQPGLYKAEARLSRDYWSDFVALRDAEVRVAVPAFRIKSAVPMGGFARSHEYHFASMLGARERTDVPHGQGARILLMARNWSPDETATGDLPQMRLERWRGDDVADLFAHGKISQSGDAVGTCAVSVTPGTYVVSVETPFGWISQAVYARAGFETQVFVLQDFTLQRTSSDQMSSPPTISMTQAIVKIGTEGSQTLYELIETAQAAVAERRPALGRGVLVDIADGKWTAPILGLLAAHLLLLAQDREQTERPGTSTSHLVLFDRDLFETILRNTAQLLGEWQPDVLALRTRSALMRLPADFEVTSPPLFLLSWELLLKADADMGASNLPLSLWRRVRGHTNAAPHFTWTRANGMVAVQQRAIEQRLAKTFQGIGEPMQAESDTAFRPVAKVQEFGPLPAGAESGDVLGEAVLAAAAPEPPSPPPEPPTETIFAVQEAAFPRIAKPTIETLASYAPQFDLRQMIDPDQTGTDADSRPRLRQQIASFARLPQSVADRLLSPATVRRPRMPPQDD